jgi:hypothetical protein
LEEMVWADCFLTFLLDGLFILLFVLGECKSGSNSMTLFDGKTTFDWTIDCEVRNILRIFGCVRNFLALYLECLGWHYCSHPSNCYYRMGGMGFGARFNHGLEWHYHGICCW